VCEGGKLVAKNMQSVSANAPKPDRGEGESYIFTLLVASTRLLIGRLISLVIGQKLYLHNRQICLLLIA
jgi:hypothetical protein